MTLPLLLGEAPGNKRSGDEAVYPLKGLSPRLMRWGRYIETGDADVAYAEMLDRFMVCNLFPEREMASPWNGSIARDWWGRRVIAYSPDVVLALGRRASDAVGLPKTWPWGRWVADTTRGLLVSVVPHPSGLNRLLNDEAMRELVGKALRDAEMYQKTRDRIPTNTWKRRAA